MRACMPACVTVRIAVTTLLPTVPGDFVWIHHPWCVHLSPPRPPTLAAPVGATLLKAAASSLLLALMDPGGGDGRGREGWQHKA